MDDTTLDPAHVLDTSGQVLEELPDDLSPSLQGAYFVNCRLRSCAPLTTLTALRQLSLRKNLLSSLVPLCAPLEALDVYDNALDSLTGVLDTVSTLTYLDVSFNLLGSAVDVVPAHARLKELFLIENRISVLPPPAVFADRLSASLRMLELGGNRLRSLGSLQLDVLEELWVGKNKIASFSDVVLPQLRILSAQSNRVTSLIDLPQSATRLEQVYLSHNGVSNFQGLAEVHATALVTLDLGTNRVSDVSHQPRMPALRELWLNNNQVSTLEELEHVRKMCGQTLTTLYAEGNPFAKHPQYRTKMALFFPELEELDTRELVRPNWAPEE